MNAPLKRPLTRTEREAQILGSIPHVTAGELAAMHESKPMTRTEHLEEARGSSVRDVIARVCGEADAAQYKPSGNHPSLTALAEHDREQRVFGMISECSALYAAKEHAK